MNILYWGPNCSSGIEQIGFIYLFLLKSLGHTIDYTNTQCSNTQSNEMNKLIHSNKYDYIILNEASVPVFKRTNFENYPKNKVFNICHSSINIPHNVIALSLNYRYHMRLAETYPIVYPLAYPFLYKPLQQKAFEIRKYTTCFVGRYTDTKFHTGVSSFLQQNNINMSYSVTSNTPTEDIPSIIQFHNLNIDEIYDLLLDTQYLLLPSTTECLSLVVGEAQVCGCIPIVLETQNLEHEQFYLSYKCFSVDEFNNTIQKIYNTYNNKIIEADITNPLYGQQWHIERVRKQLSLLFSREQKQGQINLLNGPLMEPFHEITLKNAEIITKIKL